MSAPAGARCAQHVDAEATHACGRCGDFLCERCIARRVGEDAYCDRCADHAGPAFPWEQRSELGVPRALGQTLLGTLTSPRALYARGFRDRSVVSALLYGVALSTPVALVLATVELAWPSAERLRAAQGWLTGQGVLYSDGAILARGLGAPLLFILAVSLMAVPWWVGLKGARASTRPFSHVVRACAYVQGSTAPLSLCALIPGAPDGALFLLGLVLTIGLQARALEGALSVSTSRVLGALLVAGVFGAFALIALAIAVGLLLGLLS